MSSQGQHADRGHRADHVHRGYKADHVHRGYKADHVHRGYKADHAPGVQVFVFFSLNIMYLPRLHTPTPHTHHLQRLVLLLTPLALAAGHIVARLLPPPPHMHQLDARPPPTKVLGDALHAQQGESGGGHGAESTVYVTA